MNRETNSLRRRRPRRELIVLRTNFRREVNKKPFSREISSHPLRKKKTFWYLQYSASFRLKLILPLYNAFWFVKKTNSNYNAKNWPFSLQPCETSSATFAFIGYLNNWVCVKHWKLLLSTWERMKSELSFFPFGYEFYLISSVSFLNIKQFFTA